MRALSGTRAPRSTADPVPLGAVLGRTCAAEWSRLWTVRSSWWFVAAAALIMNGIAVAAGLSAAGQADPPDGDAAWAIAPVVTLPAQFALLALALMAVTADYATGGVVPTLQWTPRRGILFLARTVVAAGTATSLGLAFALTASLGGYAAARPLLELPLGEGIDALLTVALVLGCGTALAVGLGFLLRSTAGTLIGVFLLLLVLPALLPQPGFGWLTAIADRLPGTGAVFLLTGEPTGRGFTDLSAAITMLAWAASALALGWLRFARDDVNR